MVNYPTVKVNSDGLKLEFKGHEWVPHEGEYVVFVPYLSAGDMLMLLEAWNDLAENEGDAEASENIRVINKTVAPLLVKVIDHWTWHHPITGDELGPKAGNEEVFRPRTEDIASLGFEEIGWLVNNFFALGEEGENPQ
jgi:hypothetical protein